MYEPKNEILKAVFQAATAVRNEVRHLLLRKAGIPLPAHTSFYLAGDVRGFLLATSGIPEDENLDPITQDVTTLRLHMVPGWMPGNWRIGVETVGRRGKPDQLSETNWLMRRYLYKEAHDILWGFEKAGFARAYARDNPLGMSVYAFSCCFYEDTGPGHVARAFGHEMEVPTPVRKTAARPAGQPRQKVISLASRRKQM